MEERNNEAKRHYDLAVKYYIADDYEKAEKE